jgi:hypothetical protein
MSDTKKRNMSGKGFLHKASGRISAVAFLATHREWLLTGDLAPLTGPILAKLDNNELLATPALESIKAVVLGHMVAKETAKAEAAILAPKTATNKPWLATIYNEKGDIQTRITDDGEVEDLIKGFETSSAADGWSDRRLFECSSDCYAIVNHTAIASVSSRIERNESIARIMRVPSGPVMKGQSKGSGRLSFGVKAKNDRSVFSKG